MELSPGFKQTDVGPIPDEWSATTVTGVAARVRNAIVGGPFGSDLVSNDYVDAGVPVIRGQNMGARAVSGPFAFVAPEKARSLEANLARPGDLLFTQRGTLGQVSLVPDGVFDRYLVSQSQMKVTVDRRIALSQFLYYVFSGPEQQEFIRQNTIQTGVPHINLGILRTIPVPLPPLVEQEAIAGALSDADALIESLDQLLAKKRHLKQGAMQELITGKKRLPGFRVQGGFQQTDVGAVPKDWTVAPLRRLLRRPPTYGINAAAVPRDSRLPAYLRITDIADDGRLYSQGQASVDHPAARAYVLDDGDLVFARTGASVGKSYLYKQRDGLLVFAGFLIRISPDREQLLPAFLSFYVQSPPYWNWVRVNSMRSGQPGINGREYATLPVPLPTVSEQSAIATVLADMDPEIDALEAKLAKARQIKQGMMQELLTGRIRLV